MPWARNLIKWYSEAKPIETRDIYNASTNTDNRLLSTTGTLSSSTYYFTSAYYPVNPWDTIVISSIAGQSTTDNSFRTCGYDKNRTFVELMFSGRWSVKISTRYSQTLIVPAWVYYIRISWRAKDTNISVMRTGVF